MANLNYYIQKIKTATLTEILIGINIIMFLLTTLIDFTGGNAFLILGAKMNILIAMGQFWRLLTATFLHAGIMHLVFNMMALYILGRDIERFYGPKKYLFIYFISGLVGSAFSFLLVPNTSVGASGAIFGLFGANLYLYFVNPQAYKRIFGTDFLILIGINLVISFVRPNIDVVGHIAGLVAGFIAAFGVGIYHEKTFTPKRLLLQAFTLILFIVPTVTAFTSIRSTPDFYLTSASYYYYQEKIDKAKEAVEQGLKKFPDDPQLKQIQMELNP
ncbi:rhomboid family intramembrane serine protease [Fusibacter sp. 3D3]|uniref:rhomboid family intramembrane serine protease n=1 Tax=Fusibacter sp. 3D3 TaxID=1048380 RepID=UPI000853CE62|nr:rhomboid family intramembrane serine protease [Fusibacter sp. 3D3]GAU79757.1 rhomboid family serine protease [Fusibacter sp. 3D3]